MNRVFLSAMLAGLAAVSASAAPPGRLVLGVGDGTFLVEETGAPETSLRLAHVTGDGALLDRVALPRTEGEPVAVAPGDSRAVWSLSTGQNGALALRLMGENGIVVRSLALAPALLPDGRPDGRLLVDVSPSGAWAVLRTLPDSGAASQLEWWNLGDGARFPVLEPMSSFDPALRHEALSKAVVSPGWQAGFLLSAPKERFGDVLGELASGCSANLPFGLPEDDRLLLAQPLENGLALFVVERPLRAGDSGALRIAATGVPVERQFLLLTYDSGGHQLHSEELGSIGASGTGRDLANMSLAISRDGSRLLATAGDGLVETIDLSLGRWGRFTAFSPAADESWEDAQERGASRFAPADRTPHPGR